jgi:hypothetical protein
MHRAPLAAFVMWREQTKNADRPAASQCIQKTKMIIQMLWAPQRESCKGKKKFKNKFIMSFPI